MQITLLLHPLPCALILRILLKNLHDNGLHGHVKRKKTFLMHYDKLARILRRLLVVFKVKTKIRYVLCLLYHLFPKCLL
ncbi:hypothetical protein BHE74_00059505 [Ensete ventricosum]|nr:hypothetical protein BHE74_00059505 [Ensete ventricosum]